MGKFFRNLFILAVLFCCAIAGVIYYLGIGPSGTPPIVINTPEHGSVAQNQDRPQLVDTPPGFVEQENMVAPMGTTVEGLAVVDNGFALLGTEHLEFVTGYTVDLPEDVEIGGVNLLDNPEIVLKFMLVSMQAAGINDKENLPNLDEIGDESIGLTFKTHRDGQQLRVDAVIFQRDKNGALAAVIYTEGKQPSIYVGDIAREMDERLQTEQCLGENCE